jgi:cytochrome c biogenesis protein CcdA
LDALMFILNILIAVYLFVDAPKHHKNRWLWGILGLFFSFIALGIYWILTGRKLLGWIVLIAYVVWVILGIIGVVTVGVFNGLSQ